MAGAQDGLGGLDEQTAQVFAAVPGDPSSPFFIAAVVKGRVKADVFDQLAWLSKALDITDNCSQGKRHQLANTAQSNDRQKHWIGDDLVGDQAAPVCTLFL